MLARAVLACALVLALAAFALPFLDVAVDERRGSASGLALATQSPDLRGRYVHEAYEGTAETAFADGQRPAVVAVATVVAGLVLSLLPGRLGPGFGCAAALVGLLAMLALHQTTTSAYELGKTDHRYGYWLACAILAAAAAWAGAAFAKAPPWPPPRGETRRDYFAQRG